MNNVPLDESMARPPRRRWSLGVTIAALVAIGAFIVASSSSAEPVVDPNKVVPNAADMAADLDGGSDDCTTTAFLSQDQDLWHFVVPDENVRIGSGPSDERYRLTANISAVIIQWLGGDLVRYTGTDDYDQGNAGPNLFWAYTEPGLTIEQAWLEYSVTRDDGKTPTETYLTKSHNLSHACAAREVSRPPTIDVASEASYDMLYDIVYDWTIEKTVDPNGLLASGSSPFALNYSVNASRIEPAVPGNWRIVDGSMIVTGTVVATDADMDDFEVTTSGGVCIVFEDSVLTDDAYLYECSITDEPNVTSASGLDGTNVTVVGTVTTDAGTATDSEVIPWGEPDTLILDGVIHETAYIVDGSRRTEASTGPLSLEYFVEWQPVTCPDQRVNVAELFDGVTDEPLGIDDTLTISACPPVPGLTIGYWGNKMGAPQVVAAFEELKTTYPALAAIPITNEASVRNFLTKANCSGDCVSMFLAQALGAAMNARTGAFGDQSVFFGGVCRPVDTILDVILRVSVPTDRDVRIAYKTLLDDVNNTRAIRCASVS